MQDLNDKITGGTLTAVEWNELPSEVQNIIEQTGQALSSGDLSQLGKGVAQYAANGDFYTDSGIADAYVLSAVGSKQAPTAYVDGMRIRFAAGNPNAGASTVNVATLGVKNVTLEDGTALSAGEIDGYTEAKYSTANGRFELINGVDISDFGSLIALNGFQKLPSGLIVQWGDAATSTGTGALLAFPLTFPNNLFIAVLSDKASSDASMDPVAISSVNYTTSGMRLISDVASEAYWIAIGN